MKYKKDRTQYLIIVILLIFLFSCNLWLPDGVIESNANLTIEYFGFDTIGIDATNSKESNNSRNITDETEIRQWAGRLVPCLINGSNIYIHSNSSVHIEFEVSTYLDISDIDLYMALSQPYDDTDVQITERFKIPSSAITQLKSGFELYKNSNIFQNILHINFDLPLSPSEIDELTPDMLVRIWSYNIPFQSGKEVLYGFDIANSKSTVYIPYLSSSNRHSTNTEPNTSIFDQDYIMRFIAIDTSNSYQTTSDCGLTINMISDDRILSKYTGSLPNSAQVEEIRDIVKQTAATLIYYSNTSLSGTTLNLNFKVNSYASSSDITFKVGIYDKDKRIVKQIPILASDISITDAIYNFQIKQWDSSGTTLLDTEAIPQLEYTIDKSIILNSVELDSLTDYFYYRVYINHVDLQDGLEINGHNLTDEFFSVFTSNLKDTQLESGNTLIKSDGEQSYLQRYIKVPGTNEIQNNTAPLIETSNTKNYIDEILESEYGLAFETIPKLIASSEMTWFSWRKNFYGKFNYFSLPNILTYHFGNFNKFDKSNLYYHPIISLNFEPKWIRLYELNNWGLEWVSSGIGITDPIRVSYPDGYSQTFMEPEFDGNFWILDIGRKDFSESTEQYPTILLEIGLPDYDSETKQYNFQIAQGGLDSSYLVMSELLNLTAGTLKSFYTITGNKRDTVYDPSCEIYEVLVEKNPSQTIQNNREVTLSEGFDFLWEWLNSLKSFWGGLH